MKLTRVGRFWENLAGTDPLWAILTDPAKRHGGWREDEFFATGIREAAGVIEYLDRLGRPAQRRRALDFGCGVGRVTQAFANYFERIWGVDISPGMIELARAHNRFPGRCAYVLNQRRRLPQFPDAHFDFIYSNITLQHLPRPLIRSYLTEFLRLLHPTGLLLFQLPAERLPRRPWPAAAALAALEWLYHTAYRRLRFPGEVRMVMNWVPRRRVARWLAKAGGGLIGVVPDGAAGPDFLSFRYAVVRSAEHAGKETAAGGRAHPGC